MKHMILTTALLALPVSASGQDLTDPVQASMAFAAHNCVFTETGDIADHFAAIQAAARETGLPVVVEDAKTGIYGDMLALHIIVTAGLDNLSCLVKIPASLIDHDGFEVFETLVDTTFNERHPGHKGGPKDDPSPHIDGRDWVIDTAAPDHIAATLSFGTEEGVQLAAAAQKLYQ
ncbi:MAG TPA: hypothetical protein ENK28_06155 [Aliiroseovarius sp.]|nr:hypothetical protein [Aliiroseovarius sp.]